MELVNIAGHTIDKSLLSDGVIIDVGCRGFGFSDAEEFNKKTVYCIDPDNSVFDMITGVPQPVNKEWNFKFLNVAISDKSGESSYYENGEATCLKEIDPDQSHPFKPCKTITMEDLYKITGENVDVLKLDCEGAEYIILGETFKPIPKQITCEFHYHCVPDLHMKHFDSIMERLSKDYTIHNAVWEPRHGCGNNYWDILFIRKW